VKCFTTLDSEQKKSKPEPKQDPTPKPNPKKVDPEPQYNLVRPSKAAAVEQKPVPKPVSKPAVRSEDFPSLGASGSKMSANFVAAAQTVASNSSSTWNGKSVASTSQPPTQVQTAPGAKGAPPPGFQSSGPSAKKPAPPPGFNSKAAGPMRYQVPTIDI
jgi:hypothetical protein